MHEVIENKDMRISYREGNISNEHIFENHCHTKYEIIAVTDGEIRIVIENRRYELRAGEIAFIPPFKYHSVFTLGGVLYKRLTVLFDKSFVPEEIRADFFEKTEKYPVAANDMLASVFLKMKDIFAHSERGRFLPLASSLLTEALYVHTYKDITPTSEKVNPHILKITDYINEHIFEKILLDDIAEHLFLSKSTVCHLFAEEMKISPKQYILQKKISAAAKLIEDGTPASEAGRLVGYDNYANFYKMYIKVFGVSPKKANKCKQK